MFCRIAKGDLPSHKVYEDEEHLAFLDIYPLVKGQTLVITKKHYPSYQFELPDEVYTKLLLVAKKVGKAIDQSLGAVRTFLVIEGMWVDHIHVKLYPVFKVNKKTARMRRKEIEKWYSGYIITTPGPRADDLELSHIAEKIRKSSVLVQ